uniref:Putative secreted protein n=1 Tax=Anopheles aquasalis TaxID=42839 RepID=T1DPF0_ANOAQ
MMLMMMVEQLAVTLLVCSLMIVRVDSVASPSDIISGREFLSILMKPGPVGTVAERGSKADVPLVVAAATEQPPRNRGLRRFRHFFYEQQTVADDEDETILPIEALFAEGTPAHWTGQTRWSEAVRGRSADRPHAI